MKNFKKIIIILTGLLLPFLNYGQSERDTQDWIVSNLASHIYSNGAHNYNLDFSKKGFLTITQPTYGTNYYFKLPINKINQIIISSFSAEDRIGYTIYFKCKNGEECITVTNSKPNESYIDFSKGKELYFDRSLGNENLPNRLKKAFTHLIKLNGGQTIDDVF